VVAEDDNGRAALEHLPRKLEPKARRACRQLPQGCRLAARTAGDEHNVVAKVHFGRGGEVHGPSEGSGCRQLC
jgi:hypothetical protein